MNDRELLEMAAKAAGVSAYWSTDGTIQARPLFVVSVIVATGTMPYEEEWNPLKNDGDALRLAVRLGLNISHRCVDVDVSRGHSSASEYVPTYFDRSEATRRAIVRAAAKIGAAAQKGTP